MSDSPDTNAFPASKLGDFLRAMEDPEGTGEIDGSREAEIARLELRLAEAAASARSNDPPRSG